ncbi:MAG: RsiV family protein [Neisseriaceae bacterium]|nr:RsiV family protein [Neisseriaceae bacterium]
MPTKTLFTIFILSCCLLESCSTNLNASTSNKQVIKINEQTCQSTQEKENCLNVIFSIDAIDNPKLNEYIYQTITQSKQPLNSDLEIALKNYIHKILDDMYQSVFTQNIKGSENTYTYQLELQLVADTSQLAFLQIKITNGYNPAHSNIAIINKFVDKNTLQSIPLSEILRPNTKQELISLLKNNLEAYLQAKNYTGTQEILDNFDIDLEIQNWGFNQNQLIFSFSPNIIAPKDYGIIELTIPKNKLNKIIKPKYFKIIFNTTNNNTD